MAREAPCGHWTKCVATIRLFASLILTVYRRRPFERCHLVAYSAERWSFFDPMVRENALLPLAFFCHPTSAAYRAGEKIGKADVSSSVPRVRLPPVHASRIPHNETVLYNHLTAAYLVPGTCGGTKTLISRSAPCSCRMEPDNLAITRCARLSDGEAQTVQIARAVHDGS